jgi:hypothetical protein
MTVSFWVVQPVADEASAKSNSAVDVAAVVVVVDGAAVVVEGDESDADRAVSLLGDDDSLEPHAPNSERVKIAMTALRAM